MPRTRKKPDPDTSSHNKHFVCDNCHAKFHRKRFLYYHIVKCMKPKEKEPKTPYSLEKWRQMLTCSYCKLVYGNRTLLARHIANVHESGNKSNDDKNKHSISPLKKCEVCYKMFANMKNFRLHRRKEHFNLLAKIPYCDQKKVNQVWFEKVMNCNNIVEIHKTAPNTLVMRKLDENTAIKVFENNTKIIDLSDIYPTENKKYLKKPI